jgi:AMP nucleosidase
MTEHMTGALSAPEALERLETLYAQSVANLRGAVRTYLETGQTPDAALRARGLFCYPRLRMRWFGDRPLNLETRAYARLSRPGVYSTTITRPDLFRPYI